MPLSGSCREPEMGEAVHSDSFAQGSLSTRGIRGPGSSEGMEVPEVLVSGNHQLIARWRREQALRRDAASASRIAG